MNTTFKSAMLAAAQLTAAGNLEAATAAIQRALAGKQAAAPAADVAGRAAAATARSFGPEGDIIDVEARWRSDDAFDGETANGSRTADASRTANGSRTAKAWDRADGSMLAGTFGNAAGQRDYLLYRPVAGTSAGGSRPLVIMLHGCTQTPADFAAGTAMNALADRHDFLVLYPGQSTSANPSACWNWFNPDSQRAQGGEPSIISGMVEDIVNAHPVERNRIFVAGLSAGGAMAAILADTRPDLIAAVAVHSGLRAGAAHDLPSALAAMKRGAPAPTVTRQRHSDDPRRPVRTIVFHGRQDRTVHPANGGQVADVALAGWPPGSLTVRQETGRADGGRSYTRTRHVDPDGKVMVERWEVQGAGHAWAGGSPLGSHTDPGGPDASAAMVDFFLAH